MDTKDFLHINGNDQPLLSELYDRVVIKVAHKWKDLLLQLLPSDQSNWLNIIATNHPNDAVCCCKCGFEKWLEITEDATWNQLVKALRSPGVQLNAFANQLEQMIRKNVEKLGTIQDIEVQFAKMTNEIKEALISNEVDVVSLIVQLCATSAVRNKNVPLLDKDVFSKIKSIDDFWKELRGFWTIFDYDLLILIIEISQCGEAQDIFNEFLSRIDPSTIKDTDLVLHCTEERWKGSLKPVLRIKVNAEECTPDVKEDVKEVVSKVYKLKKYALHLVYIKRGCIEFFFYISKPLKLHLITSEITASNVKEFRDHNFMNLHIDEFVLTVPPRAINLISDMFRWSASLQENAVALGKHTVYNEPENAYPVQKKVKLVNEPLMFAAHKWEEANKMYLFAEGSLLQSLFVGNDLSSKLVITDDEMKLSKPVNADQLLLQKLQAVKGGKGKTKSVVAPSKPLNSRLTSSIGQLQSSSLITLEAIHTVVTGLNEPRLFYRSSFDDYPGASLPITPENYQSDEERIKSFIGWPLNEAVPPEQLACVGFVYTGEGSLVQCFQCGVKYRHWYKGDVPLNVHQKCNPRCPFLQSFASESKSLLPEQEPTRSYIPAESIGRDIQGEEVSVHSLQFPDYSKQAVQLQSFKHWGGIVPAQELAEGGFYMIARRDVVRCFSCNVVAQDWEGSGNVTDQHQRHSPNCTFLKTILFNKSSSKGFSTLSSVDRCGQPSMVKQIEDEDELFAHLPGKVIKLPIIVKLRRSSKSDDEETIPGIHYPSNWGQHRSMSPQGSSSNLSEGSDDSFHAADSHHSTTDYNILSSINPPKTKMYEESLSEGVQNNISIKTNDSKEDDTGSVNMRLCQICYEKKIDCILLSCEHARTCERFFTKIKDSGQPCPYRASRM